MVLFQKDKCFNLEIKFTTTKKIALLILCENMEKNRPKSELVSLLNPT